MSITLIGVIISQVFAYVEFSKLFTLNVCSSFYITYTSIKLLKKRKEICLGQSARICSAEFKTSLIRLLTISPSFLNCSTNGILNQMIFCCSGIFCAIVVCLAASLSYTHQIPPHKSLQSTVSPDIAEHPLVTNRPQLRSTGLN